MKSEKIKCQICGNNNMSMTKQLLCAGEVHLSYSCPDCGAIALFVNTDNLKGLEYKITHKEK